MKKAILCLLMVFLLCGCSAPAVTTETVKPTETATVALTPTLTLEPTIAPTPTPTEIITYEVVCNNISFGDYANYLLIDYIYSLQEPFINQEGGHTYMIDENHLFAFMLDENGNILEAIYMNLDSFDPSYPDELPEEEVMYMGCLYSYLIKDSEGIEEFFDGIKLADEDELTTKYEAEFGGYKIVFEDVMLLRTLTITLNT